MRKYWRITALALVILGFSTVLPINLGKPNFLGSFTLCSFAPIATIAMFILVLSVYAFVSMHKLLLYGNLAFLLVIAVFTGFWLYDAKFPMDSIEMNITNVRFWIGEQPYWTEGKPANLSLLSFNVTLHNPTGRDIPPFYSEEYGMRINDELTRPGGFIYVELQKPLKAHSSISVDMDARFEEKFTNPHVWASLLAKNFTFTVSGILVIRYYYNPYRLDEYSIVWASKPYSISYTYTQ